VSELIHSSNAYKDTPLECACVSVPFVDIIDTGNGDEDYTTVLGTKMVMTHIARRDNSFCYNLNGQNCAFKEVAAYLESEGIDLNHNCFFIFRGKWK